MAQPPPVVSEQRQEAPPPVAAPEESERDRPFVYTSAMRASAELVTTRLNGFTYADSMDLAKVERAFREAPASMLRGAHVNAVNFVPTEVGGSARPAGSLRVDHQVFVDFGYGEGGVALFASRSDAALVDAFGAPDRIIPGLMWSGQPDQGSFLFVSVDGSRFWIGRDDVHPYSAVTAWPPPNQLEGLTDSDIEYLVEAGQLPATMRQRVEAARARFVRCAAPFWASFERRAEALDRENIFDRVRRARVADARERADAQTERRCSTRALYEAIGPAVEARRAARAHLYEAVVALHGPHP